jgi:hypothetical protein
MASQEPSNPDDIIRRISEAGRGVRLGKGVVGKTGQVAIALMALWGVIFWRLNNNHWFNGALLLGGFCASGIFVWWASATQRFAERNPAQAMLEGAEFIEYKRLEAESKGGVYINGRPDAEEYRKIDSDKGA